MFRLILTTNSDYFPKHLAQGLCSLSGRNSQHAHKKAVPSLRRTVASLLPRSTRFDPARFAVHEVALGEVSLRVRFFPVGTMIPYVLRTHVHLDITLINEVCKPRREAMPFRIARGGREGRGMGRTPWTENYFPR